MPDKFSIFFTKPNSDHWQVDDVKAAPAPTEKREPVIYQWHQLLPFLGQVQPSDISAPHHSHASSSSPTPSRNETMRGSDVTPRATASGGIGYSAKQV